MAPVSHVDLYHDFKEPRVHPSSQQNMSTPSNLTTHLWFVCFSWKSRVLAPGFGSRLPWCSCPSAAKCPALPLLKWKLMQCWVSYQHMHSLHSLKPLAKGTGLAEGSWWEDVLVMFSNWRDCVINSRGDVTQTLGLGWVYKSIGTPDMVSHVYHYAYLWLPQNVFPRSYFFLNRGGDNSFWVTMNT